MKTLQEVIKQGSVIVSGRVRKAEMVTTWNKAKEVVLPDAMLNLGARFDDGKWFVTVGYEFGTLCNDGGLDSVREIFGFYN